MKIKDESGESIVIGEKITTTLKDPQGNVRKITTIDTYKEDSGKLNNGHKHSRLSVKKTLARSLNSSNNNNFIL